jgi:hypothetical protein
MATKATVEDRLIMLGLPFKMPISCTAPRAERVARTARAFRGARWSKAPPLATASAAPYISTMCLAPSFHAGLQARDWREPWPLLTRGCAFLQAAQALSIVA